MAEWTRDAKEYLEGYLLQTAALARSRNDEVDEIVDELRNHILIETEKEAGSVVSLDQLRKVLSALGTPEQVYGQEGTLEGIRTSTIVNSEDGRELKDTPARGTIPDTASIKPKRNPFVVKTLEVIIAVLLVLMVIQLLGSMYGLFNYLKLFVGNS